jgi:Fe-S oxidoreductase
LFSKGFLERARVEVDRCVADLKELVSSTTPLIGIEPSAILGFRDEFVRMATDKEGAVGLAQNSFLIEEFLAAQAELGEIGSENFTTESRSVKIHMHCHQKALGDSGATFKMLNLPLNYNPTIIPSGCCGMAGSFGFEVRHYELSMKIGELHLFPAVRKASLQTIIAANGTSCRHQILDGTGQQALHPATILKNALK